MLVKVHAKTAVAQLRTQVPGLRRVILARTDGLPFHDETMDRSVTSPDPRPEAAASVVAALLVVAERLAQTWHHGDPTSVLTRTGDGFLVAYRVGAGHVLVVDADETANFALLDRSARRIAAELTAL